MKKIVSLLLCLVLMVSLTSGISVLAKRHVPKVTFIDETTFKILLEDEGEYYHEYYKILDGVLYSYGNDHANVKAILPENKDTEIVIPSKITCEGKDKTVFYINILSSFYKVENTPFASGKTLNNNISKIVIPDSVKWIKGLNNISSLERVEFGKNIERIEESFYGCKNLKLDIDSEKFYATDNELYEIDGKNKKLISVFKNPEVYEIPKEIIDFEMPFGKNNKSVKKIIVNHNIKSVNLKGLNSLTSFNANGYEIKELTFEENNEIKKLDLSKAKIKKLNTLYLKNLVSLKTPNGIKEINAKGCEKLKKVNLPKSVKKIKFGNFVKTGFETFKIPNSVTAVQPHTFSNCPNLRKITIPASVKTIRVNTFQGSKKLKKIVLNHKNPPKIHGGAFNDLSSGVKFYVKNKKVAVKLKKRLTKSDIKDARIYVNKKLVYKNITTVY